MLLSFHQPSQDEAATDRSLRRHANWALAAVGLSALLIAIAAGTELSGAVVVGGALVVDTNVKKIQHPTGGVVAEIAVREGMRVQAGDVLVRLDATTTKANLDAIQKSLWELAARGARLEAERDDADRVTVPTELDLADPEVARLVEGETGLFRFRRETSRGQKAQLHERVRQLEEEIKGQTEQAAAKREETEIIGREFAGVQDLWRKNLIQITRVTSLEREMTRLRGERGLLVSGIAQAKGKIAETDLQIIQIDQSRRSDAAKELAEIRAKQATLFEQRIAALDQLKRVDIRAPQAGLVHELAVHGRGAVITAGEPIMLIVPSADRLVVEARVAPQDIDQVRLGQSAGLRFLNVDQRTVPELSATVSRIGADVSEDKRSGSRFYAVRLALAGDEIKRLGTLTPMAGMPVEAYIRTVDRTVFSYLTKPLFDQARRAFRER